MKTILKASLLASLLGVSVFAVPYNLDTQKSQVGFSVKHLKLTSVEGKFQKFSGKIDYDGGALKVFEGTAETASIDTQIQKRDDHLRSEEIFNAQKFPQLTFVATSFGEGKISGNLTIKGTTKPVSLDAKIQENNGVLSIQAKTTVKRSDFGLVWESSLKDSMVSDEVQIILNLQATK